MQLKSKTALITGATSGIAEAIALKLAKEGVHLCLQYRHSDDKAEELAYKLLEYKINFKCLKADLSDLEQTKALIEDSLKLNGCLEILINCIGDFCFKPLNELTPKVFQEIIHSNLNIAFELCHFALPSLRQNLEGRILNLGYARASQLEAKPSILPYHIAKMGLILLTKSLAQTEAAHNILVNCLSPGIVENSDYWPTTNNIPLKRPAKVSEIAEAAYFLLTSDYITGTNLEIDGGWRGAGQTHLNF